MSVKFDGNDEYTGVVSTTIPSNYYGHNSYRFLLNEIEKFFTSFNLGEECYFIRLRGVIIQVNKSDYDSIKDYYNYVSDKKVIEVYNINIDDPFYGMEI